MQLITGATGNIGKKIRQLAKSDGLKLRLMARDVSKLQEEDSELFDIYSGDFSDPSSLQGAMEGVQQALLLTKPSPDQFEFDKNFIDAAKTTGVEKIVKISALGSAEHASSEMNRWQYKSEQLLINSGIDYVILRPQFFMQNLLMLGRMIQKKGQFSFPVKDFTIAMIDATDIAASALSALSNAEIKQKVYQLTGPQALSMEDVANALSALTGNNVGFKPVDKDDYIEKLKSAGLPGWSAESLGNIYVDMQRYDGYASADVEFLTGEAPTSLESFLKPYAGVFGVTN